MGGQDWGTYPKQNVTGKNCNAALYGSQLQANGYPACTVTIDNTACTNTPTSIQSPIDIPIENTTLVVYNTTLKKLNINYGTTTSWTMEVQPNYLEVADINTVFSAANSGDGSTADSLAGTGADGLTLPDGTFLPLNQFHMHTPSENTINGQYYPMEMHLVRLVRMRRRELFVTHKPAVIQLQVHKLYTNTTTNTAIPASQCPPGAPQCHLAKAAVIGVMFELAATDSAWVAKLITSLTTDNAPIPAVLVNTPTNVTVNATAVVNGTYTNEVLTADFNLMTEVFTAGLADPSEYYAFMGSLTTPGGKAGPKGCQEGLFWHVMANPIPISAAQLNVFTAVLASQQGGSSRGADNRLTQPLNLRIVQASFDPRPVVSAAPKALATAAVMVSAAALLL